MPLPYTVDTLDKIPEPLRDNYTERDGRHFLNVEGLPEVDAPSLKSALQKERETNKAIKALRKTPEEIAELIQARESASANLEIILEQHGSAWKNEKSRLESELNLARASERGAIIDATLTAALERAKATDEGHALLASRLGDRVSLETVDGKRVIRILQADGKTPMAGSGPSGAATFADLINEAVRSFPSLFAGSGGGGGGKPPGRDGWRPDDKVLTRSEFNRLSPYDQAAKARTHTIVD